MLFDHQTRIDLAHEHVDRLHDDWSTASTPARHVVGRWLIRVGRRLAPEPRRSAFAHEALPRC
jgi:hypothetical protein